MQILGWALRALVSHWRKRPLQLIGVITGLWLATALMSGVQALNGQARQSYASADRLLGGALHYSLMPVDGQAFSQQAFVDLRRQGLPVSPMVDGQVKFQNASLRILGVEPLSLPKNSLASEGLPGSGQLDDQAVVDFMLAPGQAWVAPATLKRMGWRAGEQPSTAQGSALPPLYPHDEVPPDTLLMDIGPAQRALGLGERISSLLLPAGAEAELPAPWRTTLQWRSGLDSGANMAQLTDSFHLNLTALGMLAFVVGLFIAHSAIGLALEQRRPLLRTLRACGVPAATLILALTLELLGLALLAGLGGIASGYGLAALLLPDVSASLRGLYGAQVAGELTLGAGWWAAALGIALIGALSAGAASLWRASRIPLLALANEQAWRAEHRRGLNRQALVCAAALLSGLVLFWATGGLVGAFVLLGALLFAAALALPLVLNGLLHLLASIPSGAVGQWFCADARQQLPRVGQALMALLLALAANIGIGSMTEGFRQTFSQWLEQRLSAELYVRLDDARVAPQVLQMAAAAGAYERMPVQSWSSRMEGWPVDIDGILDQPSYRQHWPLLEQAGGQPWDALWNSDSAMLSEQMARRLGVKLGDALPMPGQDRWRPRVVAIYADYGNPRGQILVDGARLQAHHPELGIRRIGLRIAPAAADALERQLEAAFGPQGVSVVNQGELKRGAQQVFEKTFAATSALNALTLGVAGIALFIGLLTQAQGRLGQLAPLWALGIPRLRLIALNLLQTWLLALLTVVCALPLGIGLAWFLVAVINVQAFGWRLPLQIFPWQLLQWGSMALFSTCLASLWPMWQLARSRPVDLLRHFANER